MRRAQLLTAAAATLLALAVCEAALRGPLRPTLATSRDRDWQVQTRAMHAALHEPDDELVYVPRADAVAEAPHGTIRHNRLGMRADTEPGEGRRRIVVLGDSIVWGDLLRLEETLPVRLEAALGDGSEVLNLGVTGYATWQELGWYRRKGRSLQPEVVIVVYCLNDMLIASNPYQLYAGQKARAALLEERAWLSEVAPLRNETVSRLWLTERRGGGPQIVAALRHTARWARLFSLPGGYVDEFLLASRDPVRSERTLGALRALGREIRADGAAAYLVISPALYWWHDYQWDEVHEQVREAGEQGGFSVIDPQAGAWRGREPEGFRFEGDNVHYTPEGVEALAAVIAGRLTGSPRK